jgi:hypothetical protein
MSIYLDVVWTNRQFGPLDQEETAVRVIGEILPFVLAKYGIDQIAPAKPRELDYTFVNSI